MDSISCANPAHMLLSAGKGVLERGGGDQKALWRTVGFRNEVSQHCLVCTLSLLYLGVLDMLCFMSLTNSLGTLYLN